jgi:drug/metabolite transporter (DMT)-like permease
MTKSTLGLIWAFSFVILEAVQAVFLGGVFQEHDSFLIGSVVFGGSAVVTLVWSATKAPDQLRIALSNKISLLILNLSTAFVWVAYFYALQMIEPAVAFTIFSGLIPITILIASTCGVREASHLRNRVEGLGIAIVILAICYLCAITLTGQSGFVRGGRIAALTGLGFTCASSVSLAVMMIYSQRLDRLGVEPTAQYGLRFPVYVLVAGCAAWIGLDAKGPADPSSLALVSLLGLLIVAFPVFAMQKAISLMSTLSLATVTALGPVFVFAFQLLEGRVAYATATMTGLTIYFVGAMLAAYGGTRKQHKKVPHL